MIPHGKTTAPTVPPDVVSRPGLFAGFDAPDAPAVGLVSAPAGYGKTVSLAVRAAGHSGTAWVSLDRHDDADLFWSAILAALVRARPGPGGLPDDLAPPRGPDDRHFLRCFRDAIDTWPAPVVLVLDDVQELDDPAALDAMRTLVRHRPRGLRLLLAGRFDPPLSLSRLRVRGELWELRADRLAFSPCETDVLVRRAGLALSPSQREVLQQRTGGWAAGLRLAVQAMRTAPDLDGFLADFSGDDRSVADYLVGEVIDTLPAATREFLTLVSVSDPVPADLAADLTGRTDAAALLDRIHRDSSLVTELARGEEEYRVLELLRTHLDAELHRRRPGLAVELHRRAARWWADRERPVEALEHAGRAADDDLLAELMGRFAVRLALTGDHQLLRRTFGSAWGIAALHRRDPVVVLCARLVEEEGDPETLRDAIAVWSATGPTDAAAVTVLHALLCVLDDLAADDADGARAELEATLTLALRHGFAFAAMQSRVLLAVAAAMQGEYGTMTALSEEVLGEEVLGEEVLGEEVLGEEAPSADVPTPGSVQRWEPSTWLTLGRTLEAYAELARAEPEAAHTAATKALEHAGDALPPSLRHALRVVHGAARADSGRPADGLEEMREARLELDGHPVLPVQAAAAALLEHRAALRLGLPATAVEAVGAFADTVDAPAELALMSAWTELHRHHDDAVRARLEPIVSGAVVPLLPETVVETHLVQVVLAARAGDADGARRSVDAALGAAELLELLRPFAQADGEAGELLVAHEAEGFAERAQAAYRRSAGPGTAALTERELAVLALLPSLMPFVEIGAALSVSRTTVKTHVQVIYAKLGVQSRRAAVQTARGRGLLPDADDAFPSGMR